MNETRGLWRGKRKLLHNYETGQDVFEWVGDYYTCFNGKERRPRAAERRSKQWLKMFVKNTDIG